MSRIYSFLSIIVLFISASCEKTSSGKQNATDCLLVGYLPKPEHIYQYKLYGKDDTPNGTEIIRVTSIKDSLNTKIYNVVSITTHSGDTILIDSMRLFSHEGLTYSFLVSSPIYKDYIRFQQIPDEDELTLTGYPQLMAFTNRGSSGDEIQFIEPSVELYRKEIGDGKVFEEWRSITYQNGKAVAVEEVTTDAGIFNCVKWRFEKIIQYRTNSWGTPSLDSQTLHIETQWLCHEIGIVKSTVQFFDGSRLVTDQTRILSEIRR